MWWVCVVGGVAAWVVVGSICALIIGRSIHLADVRSESRLRSGALTPADALGLAPAPSTAVRVRRRPVPLPPVGVALVAVALALETVGYAVRLTGATGPAAQLFSMDAPFSMPRMFVALLFAVGALAAVAGAGAFPSRRTWWLAVAFVAGVIAAVKAGSTVHSDALGALADVIGGSEAVLVSGLIAAAGLGVLWYLSRNERRDRRRVISVLTLYAAASVGLSALSTVAAWTYGGASSWAAGATYLEESGEALAGVAFLFAVLVGVAPRLVLPRDWAMQRAADQHALDLPAQAPGRSTAHNPAAG